MKSVLVALAMFAVALGLGAVPWLGFVVVAAAMAFVLLADIGAAERQGRSRWVGVGRFLTMLALVGLLILGLHIGETL